MSDEKNLSSLVKIVSGKTHQNPELVKHFFTLLFKEIEKELVTTSHIKIDGLGIFRIISSIPSDKILFLDKFDGLNKPGNNISVKLPEIELNVSQSERVYAQDNVDGIHNNTTFEDLNSSDYAVIDNEDDSVDEVLQEYDELRMGQEKKKRISNIGLIVLFTAIILGIIALLIFLYPKEKNDTLYAPIERVQAYSIIENTDTTLYISRIVADYELDFPSLSFDFYGSELFWPYIYKANEMEVNNLLEIKAGTIINIPKLASELIDKKNKESVERIKILQQEIISLKINQQ